MGGILRNISVLNIILLVLIVLVACFVILPIFVLNAKYTLPAVQKAAPPAADQPGQKETPSILDYMIIAEKNLFHPERHIPAEKTGAEAKPLPKPEFVLYGTLVTDEGGLAYVEDKKSPRKTPGRGERVDILRRGDVISGFTVKSIEPDKVVLARGEELISLAVTDPKRRKEGARAPHPSSPPAAANHP